MKHKCRINIGTNKGNIVNVPMNKEYNQIRLPDVFEIALKKFGNDTSLRIHGWCLTHKDDQS